MIVTIIGTGLIGGSMALILKDKKFAAHIIGVDNNESHRTKAIALQLADEFLPLEEAVLRADVTILAVPADQCIALLPSILDISADKVVIDTSSVKLDIVQRIQHHRNRSRFVASHPMWGTEFSGPGVARQDAFTGKAVVLCDLEESDQDAIAMAMDIYGLLGMRPVYMTAATHDTHVAYISHLSHITSFALANTVLQKEEEEEAIFALASGGFDSTVRLAKSNPAMWTPILLQNRENILAALEEHIRQLEYFKEELKQEHTAGLYNLMHKANAIGKILNSKNQLSPSLHT